ncbi:MAG: hypothetical protein WC071_04980 [Victivallaceae bacterium]
MSIEVKINPVEKVPLTLPEDDILSRLGRNRHLNKMTGAQNQLITQLMQDGFALCELRGVWARLQIKDRGQDFVQLENGDFFRSAKLEKLLVNSHAVLLFAATAGTEIVKVASHCAANGDGVKALVFDAVGSEAADGAVNWIQLYVDRQLKRFSEHLTQNRFSPGYGDLGLENQQIMFNILHLDRLGVRLSPDFILAPEKTVTAVAGIEQDIQEQI